MDAAEKILNQPSYGLARRLAVGGMAEVMLATKRGVGGFEKLVVIKRILPHLAQDEQFVQMFLNEARLAASLKHPNIVEIYDIHQNDQGFFLVMEYLPGEDLCYLLKSAVKRDRKVPVGIVCRIVANIADGLYHAHTATDLRGYHQGIVHRDVAPSNVIVTYSGHVKLVDFGVAKAKVQNVHTRPGIIKGKFSYVSPEQIGGQVVDARSDIFSLGVLLYELLTIRRLFAADSDAAVLKAVMEAEVPPPSTHNPEVPEALDRLVLQMLDRDPDDRPETAAVVQDGLEEVLSSLSKTSNRAVGAFMQTFLAHRYYERQSLERLVAREHEQPAARPDRPLPQAFNTPAAHLPSGEHTQEIEADSSLLIEVEEMEQGFEADLATATPPEPRRGARLGIMLGVGVGSTIFFLLAFAAIYLMGELKGRRLAAEVPPPAGQQVAEAAPEAVPLRSAALVVHVVPEGARLTVDGEVLQAPVGPSGVLVPVSPDAPVQLAVAKPGFQPRAVTARGPQAGVEHVYISLPSETKPAARVARAARKRTPAHRAKPRPETVPEPSAEAEPGSTPEPSAETAPTPETAPAPTPLPRAAHKPPMKKKGIKVPASLAGDPARGRTLFKAGCRKCHGHSVKQVSPTRYTSKQWVRFFARCKHLRRAPYSGRFTIQQLAHVRAYLMANSADSRGGVAAGLK